MQSPLKHIIVEHNPRQQPIDKAVILLHGLGASANDFVPFVPALKLPEDLAVRFVFPQAPSMPVTINGGYVMPAWYDILEMSVERQVDIDHIVWSSNAINTLIDIQIQQGVPSTNIIVAGFSQGGAVAYHNVLTNNKKLAGLLALSTYFATKEQVHQPIINKNIAIKIDHGMYDDVVPMALGVQAKTHLEALGLRPVFSSYPAMHHLSNQQLLDIGQWITQVFNN
ncbi:MAG: carboxylesterase [Moraxella sp.]|nr:carboxylesterase [Moraxella sp.]